MDKLYFLGRKRASRAMARKAIGGEARLIHLELAGRYAVLAANAVTSGTALPPVGKLTLAETAAQAWTNEGGA